MSEHNTASARTATCTTTAVLLTTLFTLLAAHRPAFGQERCYHRALALALAELFAFARHTVTQCLLTLGLPGADWSAWYRLFSRPRFDEEALAATLMSQTLPFCPASTPYVVGVDATQIPRSSAHLPGSGWLPAPRTAVFRRGIHRAQRFVQGAWLPPREDGYSRAIPLRFLPAFPPKACPADAPVRKEWEAGLEFLRWTRQQLDVHGRTGQRLLGLGDGAYDTVALWRGLPAHTTLVVRTAKNRKLRELPGPYGGKGCRRKYGQDARHPAEWLPERQGWTTGQVLVRGRLIRLVYRVEGPFLREGAPEVPLFLIVVRGARWRVGPQRRRTGRRDPAFYLVNAEGQDGTWQLPLPESEILAWIWQRWELEVAHREMKTSFGIGQKQCWAKRSAVVSVQWGVWLYALLVLAGYQTWGLLGGPRRPERWWGGARRWSFNTLWRAYRAALWGTPAFRPVWSAIGDNWPKKEGEITSLINAALGAARG
jgi:hypothetical protein